VLEPDREPGVGGDAAQAREDPGREGRPVQGVVPDGEGLPQATEQHLLVGHQASDAQSVDADAVDVGTAGAVQVAIDATVTPELAREGLARDVVRQIQQFRKDLKLEIQDRITVTFHTDDPELPRAITEWESYIKQETLCDSLNAGPPDDSGRWVELGDRKLWLKVRKV